ncbi:hypothetical protein [Chromobacterium vaccinii]|uniref:hypothetical protein n=1 Tax=Chromobacterium vaccinii TaxID=1108595 RepID=UPI000617D7CD|nr:hypothetical protein [Chromobacterium vaccinii]SUX56103.1 Uncharacterised protein [Chromobacterium vaccinii]
MPGPLGINGAQSALPIQATQAASSPQVGQTTGASSSPLPGPSSQKAGALYAPFAEKDILMMTAGKNHPRDINNKTLYPLIARNDQDHTKLEQLRQETANDLEKLGNDSLQLMARVLRDQNLTPEQLRSQMGPSKFDHYVSSADKMLQRADTLRKVEIRSNENGQELSRLRPGQDKLYVLGHGGHGLSILAADEKCEQGMVTAADLTRQLTDGGLNKAFNDIRVTACYSADTKKPTSFHPDDLTRAAQPNTKRGGFLGLIGRKIVTAEPFAQTLSNELKKSGFTQPHVAGYHGAGLQVPSSNHQQRRLPGTQEADVRSSDVRQRFTPTK